MALAELAVFKKDNLFSVGSVEYGKTTMGEAVSEVVEKTHVGIGVATIVRLCEYGDLSIEVPIEIIPKISIGSDLHQVFLAVFNENVACAVKYDSVEALFHRLVG